MQKLVRLFAISLLLITGLMLFVQPVSASVDDFTIDSFEADYYLSRDNAKTSHMRVEEVITVRFPNFDQNHGILRAIPEAYQDHTVSLDNIKVTNAQDQPLKFSASSSNNNRILKIGDADRYVHGQQVYKVSYSLRNVINFQETDELYWDINGDQWRQPTIKVIGRLHLDKDLGQQLTGQTACFSGIAGSTETDCTVDVNEQLITISGSNLTIGGNISMVIGFNKGTFALGPEVAREKRFAQLLVSAIVACITIPPLITFAILFPKWRREGRDPKGRGTIIPEYVSPKGLNVLNSGFVYHQTVKPTVISASIIELAVAGYLKVNEVEKKSFLKRSTDYELIIAKDITHLPEEQKIVLEALFSSGTSVGASMTVSAQKNKLYNTITQLSNHLAQQTTSKGYFATNPNKARKRFIGFAIATLVIGIILFIFPPLGIGLTLSAILGFVFGNLMPARTTQGVQLREYMLGLKDYIAMAEKDRIAYLQSPQGASKKHINPSNHKQQIHLFEDLLPYAMLFGLEKQWAEEFKDLYSQPPDWYGGNMHTFSTVHLANSLHSFNADSGAAFSSPSSSGSSGFSGGGSSGGGGGGGGGGGW